MIQSPFNSDTAKQHFKFTATETQYQKWTTCGRCKLAKQAVRRTRLPEHISTNHVKVQIYRGCNKLCSRISIESRNTSMKLSIQAFSWANLAEKYKQESGCQINYISQLTIRTITCKHVYQKSIEIEKLSVGRICHIYGRSYY